MRTAVDVHLVILIVPIETPPGLTDGEVALSVGLHRVLVKDSLREGVLKVCFT